MDDAHFLELEGFVGRIPDQKPLTSSETRLINLLESPMTLASIVSKLGVSRQRVHQIVKKLLVRDIVRLGGSGGDNAVIARSSDDIVLLDNQTARIISRLRSDRPALLKSIGASMGMKSSSIYPNMQMLEVAGLVIKEPHFSGKLAWKLTPSGEAHPQRKPSIRQATLASSGVRSERTANVLKYLAHHGPTRGVDISRALDLDKTSMNALMQYLKGKGWISKTGDSLLLPYKLTETGLKVVRTLTIDDDVS